MYKRSSITISFKDFNIAKLVISDQKSIITKSNIKMKLADIGYLNPKGELCDLYIRLPSVETYGAYPQYVFGSTSKTSEDINGYIIFYCNKEVNTLFKKISKMCSKKFTHSNIKPVFIKNEYDIETAYLKLKMNKNNNDIETKFYSDKKCKHAISGQSIIRKFGTLSPTIHLKSIYFGSHGSSEFNASFQITVAKAIFEEKVPYEPECSDSDEEEEEEEDEKTNNYNTDSDNEKE